MGAQWKAKGRAQAADAKGRLFTKLVKEIIVAAKSGADPAGNPRLRLAVEAAKKASMPRDTMERAIKKGAGLLDEPVNYETVTYEGFAPHKVPVIVECLTDNKNRTASNVRNLFRKGQIATSGAVSWDFEYLGVVEAHVPAGQDPEAVAIEAGAQDLEAGDDGVMVLYTKAADLDAVTKAVQAAGIEVSRSALAWKAKNPVTSLDATQRAEVEAFLEALDADDDVQSVYVALGG
jgi:YebC/PmpR family DNA-binding regulatory protein